MNNESELETTNSTDQSSNTPSAQEVEQNIKKNIWSFKKSHYTGFSILLKADGTTDYRSCNYCYKTYAKSSRKPIEAHSKTHLNETAKLFDPSEQVLSSVTNFIIADNRPFNMIDTPYFKKFLSEIINSSRVCDKKGVDLSNFLPDSYAVAREIESKYKAHQEMFLSEQKPIAVSSGFSCTVDFSQSGPDYAVITLHYIDNEWSLKSQILNFIPYPLDQDKSAQNISEFIKLQLLECGFNQEDIINVVFVTDEASNMKNFENHLICACHLLNTVGLHVTSPYVGSELEVTIQDKCKSIGESVIKLQGFVAKLRSVTVIRQLLGTALHVPVITRWLSKFTMVDSFITNADEIKRVIKENRPKFLSLFKTCYEDILPSLEAYKQVVKPLEIRIKKLEADKSVTISQYALAFLSMHNIWANLQENPSEDIQALAKSGIEALEKKMSKWNEKYLMAGCYLDPKMRLQLYSLIDKSKFLSKSKIESFIRSFHGAKNLVVDTTEEDDDFMYVPVKRQMLGIDREMCLYDSLYVAEKEKNPLDFWKRNELNLPILAKIAREILCVPASSASSERAFSQFKLATPPSRNRLSDERIQQLMILKSFLKNIEML